MVRRLRPVARCTALSFVVSRKWRTNSRISMVSILLPAISPPSATERCSLLEGYTFFRRKARAVVQYCRRCVDCAALPTTPFILWPTIYVQYNPMSDMHLDGVRREVEPCGELLVAEPLGD